MDSVTNRDIDFIDDHTLKLADVMTTDLILARESCSLEEANDILKKSKKSKKKQEDVYALNSGSDLDLDSDDEFDEDDTTARCPGAVRIEVPDPKTKLKTLKNLWFLYVSC